MFAKLIAVGVTFVGVLAFGVGLSALVAWPVQWLWNGVAVNAIDGLHKVSFLHAWGLTILSSFLFKSHK